MSPVSFINLFLAYASRLRFKNLFFLILTLFVVDLLVPDILPFFDEIVLGLLAVLLASWKKEQREEQQATRIEGDKAENDNLR